MQYIDWLGKNTKMLCHASITRRGRTERSSIFHAGMWKGQDRDQFWKQSLSADELMCCNANHHHFHGGVEQNGQMSKEQHVAQELQVSFAPLTSHLLEELVGHFVFEECPAAEDDDRGWLCELWL
mmetsp:Transcript_34266/g.51676  ORF Transcript_34266/g.51676 Transcript_34266/m.51676 type:complete len:125 (+) Transcript_34266:101-475(+)